FAGDKRRRNCARRKTLEADVGHVQQTMWFIGVAENTNDTFSFEKFGALLRSPEIGFVRIADRRLAKTRWRLLQWAIDFVISIAGRRRRKAPRLLIDNNGAFQLAV